MYSVVFTQTYLLAWSESTISALKINIAEFGLLICLNSVEKVKCKKNTMRTHISLIRV